MYTYLEQAGFDEHDHKLPHYFNLHEKIKIYLIVYFSIFDIGNYALSHCKSNCWLCAGASELHPRHSRATGLVSVIKILSSYTYIILESIYINYIPISRYLLLVGTWATSTD